MTLINLTLKCVNFWKEKSHRFLRWDFLYLSAAEFIRWPSTLGTPEGQLEQPQATGTEPQALLGTVFPLQGGVREGLFGRVVGLLERAEESCEGLKHGYYDLPCVHFLILCHSGDIRLIRCFASPPFRLQNHRR